MTAGDTRDGPAATPYGAGLPAAANPAPSAYPVMVPGGPPSGPVPSWTDGLRPVAGEVASVVRLGGLLLLTGFPLGFLWWFVAPRRQYDVGVEGAFAIEPESEAAVGSDGWFMLLTGVLSLVAALTAWRFLRHRGPLVAVGLAGGMLLCGLLTWFVGSLLGPGPSAAELAMVGNTVLGPLELRAQAVLVVGPFLAVAGYLLGACFTARDDLGRAASPPPASVGRARDAELDEGHGHGV